jgi:hypothetical protein
MTSLNYSAFLTSTVGREIAEGRLRACKTGPGRRLLLVRWRVGFVMNVSSSPGIGDPPVLDKLGECG